MTPAQLVADEIRHPGHATRRGGAWREGRCALVIVNDSREASSARCGHGVVDVQPPIRNDVGCSSLFSGSPRFSCTGRSSESFGSRFSDAALVCGGAAILTTSFLLFTSPSRTLLYVGALLFSLGNGLMWPSFLALLANAAGERFQGAIQGFGSSVGSLASIAGGILYETVGGVTFVGSAGLTLLVAALVLVYTRMSARTARKT